MGLSRSTYYDVASLPTDDAALVATMRVICDEFEAYGYRRVGAELRHRGIVVNSKKIRRLMRENDLQPKRRKRFVATTDSDHDGPIFPDLARDRILDGPNQVWVADITYIAIAVGFVYMAAILDAWSRRVVGYAIGRSIDARLAVAALKAAIRARQPPKGCIHHSDPGRAGRYLGPTASLSARSTWNAQRSWHRTLCIRIPFSCPPTSSSCRKPRKWGSPALWPVRPTGPRSSQR